MKTTWIRHREYFIRVDEDTYGKAYVEITKNMPDVPVRDMLVAATFEGTFIQHAAIKSMKEEPSVTLFKPTVAEQAKRLEARANYPWPIKIVLGLVEFALYVVLGGLALAIIAAPIVLVGWLTGKVIGAW